MCAVSRGSNSHSKEGGGVRGGGCISRSEECTSSRTVGFSVGVSKADGLTFCSKVRQI